ncbi:MULTISPECIES: AbrB/MazE/SpoVT family DNA-binding domain-containing protein [Caproicibacterium]|jgi:AbrB family looped-hinge helix DNA binding protein|uniref:SpoVT-AbrB domain-containing protein n=1 Tax=Caproicibacterium lactatifermentans TaxID=2666138 RepID=A0A859DQU3_9FIRM|nr:AbrB/MazE/SpoVT family DNA-binding domain-containing protein [Caproicibacterium lactatifermentans]ARP50453.1 hypothetical protein B6259_05905 [Ruminococcaceae bacterium CPB6]MDD4807798.1 AbrB/MazE/SpoVT family DNA-binding domain-containing protein [Oscillospiraceae bacterium]QKN23825.1 hypothetical protein GJQ69_04635 [Caproicibacterium lactatifermentans]QKO31103.1 hypothetical protein GKP14_08915 [Caproicibacterium lactatifermentans]
MNQSLKGNITIYAIGEIRCIDKLGRLVIPKSLRDRFGMFQGQAIEMVGTDAGILVRPAQKKE